MRISSLTYFTTSLSGMQANQNRIARLSEQIGSGQRILSAKDDPLDAEKAMQLSNRVAVRAQHLDNQQKAGIALDLEATVLKEIRKTLTDVRDLAVYSNASQDSALQSAHADQLSGYYFHLKDLANTQDSDGKFIFAGYRTDLTYTSPPFQHIPSYPGVAASGPTDYTGTPYGSLTNPAGTRDIEVGNNRTLQVSDNLDIVFQSGSVGGVANGGTADILQLLDQFAVDMGNPALTYAQKETAIAGAINAFTAALERLSGVESRVAAAQIELKDIVSTTESLQLLERNALTELTSVDKAAAIVEMQSRQTSLEAAQRAYAQSSQLSLFSYL